MDRISQSLASVPENLVHFPPASSRSPLGVGHTCAVFLDQWNGDDVADGARALSDRLPEHVPGALRLVIARALRQLDVPPFASVQEFRGAVARFAVRPIELSTISDVRRARRARRTTLARIAEQTGLPVYLLRQLEWGDFRQWGDVAWTERVVRAYARAAELDEKKILPIIKAEREAQLVPWVAPEPVALGAVGHTPSRDRRRSIAAAAMLVASLGLGGVVLERTLRPDTGEGSASRTTTVTPPDLPRRDAPAATATRGEVPRNASRQPRTPAAASPPEAARPTLVKATTDRTASFSPAFSSAGSAVFYHRNQGGGSALMKAEYGEGGDLRVINIVEDGARNYHVRPSPDGTRIAFDSDRDDGERGVYVATADGRDVRRVSGPGFAAVPSWSPDGTHLAYVRAETDRRVWNLWLLDLRTEQVRRLTSYRYGQPWGASWFPDGRRVAYTHEDRLKILDLQTGRTRTYKTPHTGRLMRTPAVSPDGHHVAFQVYRDGAWLLDITDGSMQRILTDPTAEEFAWDAQGRRLAFHSRRSGQWSVWIMASPRS